MKEENVCPRCLGRGYYFPTSQDPDLAVTCGCKPFDTAADCKAEQWSRETMLLINRLTPDIKGKAFDPDWFELRQRLETVAKLAYPYNPNNR